MGNWITQKEKEGHLKTKTKFKGALTGAFPTMRNPSPKKILKGVTGAGEDAAVYDVEKNKSNKYASINRHLISKLKG